MTRTLIDHPYLVGGTIGLASVPVHMLLPFERSVEMAALLIAMIAGAYIGFAARAEDGRLLVLEILVAVAFGLVAFAGLWWSAWIIPGAYIAHAGWDALHRHENFDHILPGWYVPFCLAVDVLAGIGIALVWAFVP